MLEGSNTIILDLETYFSADDCLTCKLPQERHGVSTHPYAAIGWDNKAGLGLSIGCYWSYADMALHWFDTPTLEATVRQFVETQPLLVSWNGLAFDGPLLRAILRRQPELHPLCDAFKDLMGRGYDALAAIWQVDPARKFERGLNSLGAVAVANGYGAKEMDGAMAPRLWRAGRIASVVAYNVSDVLKTKALFEQIVATGSILRGDGKPITLPRPVIPAA